LKKVAKKCKKVVKKFGDNEKSRTFALQFGGQQARQYAQPWQGSPFQVH
jgi:hypothetical protein